MEGVKWIKIMTNVFNDQKIVLIESMPEADAIIVIWFKLLCLAGMENNDGVFFFRQGMPYTDEMLAVIFRRNINTVRLALKTFENLGMIEIIDGVVSIPKWNYYQNFNDVNKRRELDKERQRRCRAKQKALIEAQNLDATEESGDIDDNNVTRDVTHVSRVTERDMSRDVTNLSRDPSRESRFLEEEEEVEIEGDIQTTLTKRRMYNTNNTLQAHHDDLTPSEGTTEHTEETEQKKPRKPRTSKEKPSVPSEPPVIQIELNDGSLHDVTKADFELYEKLYPGIDVMQELRNIAGWNAANPRNRKTKSGIKRHINTWLSRTQNSARRNSYGHGQPYTPVPQYDYDHYDDTVNPF